MKPIVSIIVPCYNQAQYLSEALESVLAQSLPDWECVIVNDGSTDNTLVIANEWAKRDGRYVVVDKENGGLADARNAGIKASHGKYILPLDADDKIGSTYIEKAVYYLEEHCDTKLVYCYAEFFGDENGTFNLPEYNYEKILWKNMIFCSAIYRREDYDMTIGYNSNMKYGLEDWDFWLSLLSKDDKVYRIPEVEFYYRKHGVSMIDDTCKRTDYNLKQLVLNHIDTYQLYLPDIFNTQRRIARLEEHLDAINNSTSFRLGYAIVRKYYWIKSKLLWFCS